MRVLIDGWLHWIARKPLEAFGIGFAILGVAFWPINAAFPGWKPLTAAGIVGTALVTGAVLLVRRTVRTRCYYSIVLTYEEQYKVDVLSEAKRFFSRGHIAAAKPRPLVEVEGVETLKWQELLDQSLEKIVELRNSWDEIHLTCQAYWMWCFALGTRIQDRHPMVLYHFQNGTYHRIWTISREIKNRKAVDAATYRYSTCAVTKIKDGPRSDALILIIACGAHDPTAAVQDYAQANLSDLPIHVIRVEGGLAPEQPNQWIGAAADIAAAIDSLSASGSKEIFLFGTMPDTLGLMTGSAVGPYRRVHLMQYHNGSYFESLELSPKP